MGRKERRDTNPPDTYCSAANYTQLGENYSGFTLSLLRLIVIRASPSFFVPAALQMVAGANQPAEKTVYCGAGAVNNQIISTF